MISSFTPSRLPPTTEMKPELAFLGPKGTYSHQAAYDHFGESVEYVGRSTIADVYESVRSGDCPVGVIPQENSIHGIVIETYDILRGPDVGREVFVRGEVTIGIQHCLITRKGVALENVRRILSHEQALGQCGQFIQNHLKNVVLVKTSSTVAAVEALLSDEEDGYSSAAIASSVCERLFNGIQVLYKGIQDESLNFTRFYILARSIDGEVPTVPHPYGPWLHPSSQNKGLVRIRESQSQDPLSGSAPSLFCNGIRGGGLANLLSALDLQICRVDRRPMLGAKTFAHVYILEVDDGDQSPSSANSSPIIPECAVVVEDTEAYGGNGTDMQSNKPLVRFAGDGGWVLRLRQAVERVLEAGGDAEVLGCW